VSLEHYAGDSPVGRRERFEHCSRCQDVTLADPDGRTSYVITRMSVPLGKAAKPTDLMVSVDIHGPVEYRQYCDIVAMSADPKAAPVAQFHGPLTAGPVTVMWQLPPDLCLRRGDKPPDLRAVVGTMDAGKGCWVVVRAVDEQNKPYFPPGVHPFADVEFPPRRPGDPPVHRHYPLDHTC
jgi:hypothetical protein